MAARRRRPIALAAAALALVPLLGFVPRADRIARATARANAAAGRSEALQIDLTLRVVGRDPIGTGTLVTHPNGLARLELRDAADRVERHLLLGTEHLASRNGEELERPRDFLPPLFFLQVDSPATLRQALSDHGFDVDAVALEPCGTSVCYVIGDPSRVAPPAPDDEGQADGGAAVPRSPGPPIPPPPDQDFRLASNPVPTLWIESTSYEIVRIESATGVVVDFGPLVAFGAVRFPDSITIHEPDRQPIRFDILGVTPVNAPAAGFKRAWLQTPAAGDPMGDAAGSARAPAAPSGAR